MQRILLLTDFSENAWNAIAYALELFATKKCTFYFLHIHSIPGYSGAGTSIRSTPKTFKEVLHKESQSQMTELLATIDGLPFDTDHNFITLTEYGYFTEVIKNVVDVHKIDLIVMGTRGASGIKKMTIGSNTADVLTKVQIPLLAIPEEVTFTSPKEIVFPTDYHTGYEVKVLDTLLYFSQLNQANIRVLHISKKGESLSEEQLKNQDFLRDYLVGVHHSFHSLTGTDIETAVQCFTESRDINMIAMVAKNLNFFQRILFRPQVKEISYHTKVPFLVLHE
jgi:nucleotide-binding universal stress UspA family protein